MSNQRPRMGQALAPIILFATVASGCADKPVPVRKEQPQALTAQVRAPATIPERLRGVWYVDDTEGHASCRKYLTTDPATIERTGADPLVGAVVISSRIVHHYSEYGEGYFFLVDTASPVTHKAWRLSGNVSVDSFSDDDEYGLESSESFELSNDETKLSISDGTGRTLSLCGDVRNDLYRIDSANETHVAEKKKPPNETSFPTDMLGTWALGDAPCSLPVSKDADGVIEVSEGRFQGYEYYVIPSRIVIVGEKPLHITLEGKEVYLGSQILDVTQAITIDGDRMQLKEGRDVELYTKCK